MTSLDLCQRAIEFRKPERLPMSYPSCGFTDIAGVAYTAPKGWKPSEPGQDEWGAVWEKTEVPNMGQMKKHALRDWANLKTYRFPEADDDSRYDKIEPVLNQFPDKYIICMAETILTLWERYYSLRGFDQALMDFHLYPDKAHDLLERVLEFHIGIMKNLGRRFRGRIHAFGVSDDWGTQHSTLISVPMWRTFFRERYRRLVNAIHDAGMHAILHSDGRINDLIPDLIEVGFDGFNLHSPTVVGIEEVGIKFAGKVAFLPCIDIQNTYARGTPDDVQREAKLLLEYWGTRDGGIIPAEYGREAVGAPIENMRAAFEAFREFGMERCGAAHEKPARK